VVHGLPWTLGPSIVDRARDEDNELVTDVGAAVDPWSADDRARVDDDQPLNDDDIAAMYAAMDRFDNGLFDDDTQDKGLDKSMYGKSGAARGSGRTVVRVWKTTRR